MRQNLTNVKETQLDKVDSFYIVGSTTKEGLIEGRSNVKIDLKKAVAEGGGGEQPFDAKKFGDDVVKQLYDSDLEFLVFPDLYLIPLENSVVAPDSAEMFAASLITQNPVTPLYASFPDSGEDIIARNFNRLPVTNRDFLTVDMDGKTYYIFKNGTK